MIIYEVLPYTMKVLRQKSFTASCTRKLPRQNFCGIPHSYFLLNPYLNSAILNFHIKKVCGHANVYVNILVYVKVYVNYYICTFAIQ